MMTLVYVVLNKNHLKEQKLTYFQHLRNALKEAFRAGIVVNILFIHAVFPFIFDNYFSRYIKRTNMRLTMDEWSVEGYKKVKK
jgi:hypothetical protein